VWGEHDRNFWDLTRQIEREVEMADWKHGGRRVGKAEFYNPDDQGEEEHVDGGGWTGGEYVLGERPAAEHAVAGSAEPSPLSRREVMARAAEARLRRQDVVAQATKRKGAESEKRDSERPS
jgi:hypothetical protein